jgi:hypothetical protein
MLTRKYFICLCAASLMFISLFFIDTSSALTRFYIFKGEKNPVNNSLAVEKRGDTESISYRIENDGVAGSVIKVLYRPTEQDKHDWVSISWVTSSYKGEFYDIAGAERIAFLAKGREGREIVQFEISSISNRQSKTTSASTEAIILTDEWQEYSIDLEEVDLSSLKAAFSLTINRIDNLGGADIYLDKIRYEIWD